MWYSFFMGNDSFIRPDELWESVGLRADQTVAHLGCGAGFYLIPAARIIGRNGKAYGIDILPDMLAEVESRARRERLEHVLKTRRANLENPKSSGLDDSSIDWVLVANILHQSDPARIFQEASRIVASTGRVLVIEWDTSASPFGPPAGKRRLKAEVIEIAKQAGLTVEKELKPSAYHYGLILKKSA